MGDLNWLFFPTITEVLLLNASKQMIMSSFPCSTLFHCLTWGKNEASRSLLRIYHFGLSSFRYCIDFQTLIWYILINGMQVSNLRKDHIEVSTDSSSLPHNASLDSRTGLLLKRSKNSASLSVCADTAGISSCRLASCLQFLVHIEHI